MLLLVSMRRLTNEIAIFATLIWCTAVHLTRTGGGDERQGARTPHARAHSHAECIDTSFS